MGGKSPFLVFIVVLTFVGLSYQETDEALTKKPCVAPDGKEHICGENAMCFAVPPKGHICHCMRGYAGDPYQGCVWTNPECLTSSECDASKACHNDKCVDVCENTCGLDAACKVTNHNPVCYCPEGYLGDPFVSCVKNNDTVTCGPTSCGVNAECHVVANNILCSCLEGYLGNPLGFCRKQCESKSECPESDPVCKNSVCVNPCEKSCGTHASCKLVEESPVCTCPEGTTGNPLKRCFGIENPCDPTSCGAFTACSVVDNKPVCTCLTGYEGNPLEACHKHPCNGDSDCGLNATCFVSHKAGIEKNCQCSEGSYGDPFVACHTDSCSEASQCPSSRPKCVKNACIDDCNNQCGMSAVCQIVTDSPICICPDGYTGNPFFRCLPYDI